MQMCGCVVTFMSVFGNGVVGYCGCLEWLGSEVCLRVSKGWLSVGGLYLVEMWEMVML